MCAFLCALVREGTSVAIQYLYLVDLCLCACVYMLIGLQFNVQKRSVCAINF